MEALRMVAGLTWFVQFRLRRSLPHRSRYVGSLPHIEENGRDYRQWAEGTHGAKYHYMDTGKRGPLMVKSILNEVEAAFLQRQKALSRWDNEGGARAREVQADVPELTNTELVHLRVRVIALENLIITLLAEGSDRQLDVAREMATYIAPRAGSTQHPLTIRAADHMTDMVDRAMHFREVQSSSER